MAKIKIDPEVLKTSSSKIQTQITELHGFNDKLSGLLEEINSQWNGKFTNQYYNLMQNYKKKAVHMESVLAAFKKYADTAVSKFEALDQECANKINGSF